MLPAYSALPSCRHSKRPTKFSFFFPRSLSRTSFPWFPNQNTLAPAFAAFSVATNRLYMSLCRCVRPSVRPISLCVVEHFSLLGKYDVVFTALIHSLSNLRQRLCPSRRFVVASVDPSIRPSVGLVSSSTSSGMTDASCMALIFYSQVFFGSYSWFFLPSRPKSVFSRWPCFPLLK